MKIQRISGIQKKYLINIVLLLALALLLSSVGVGVYVRKTYQTWFWISMSS